MGNQDIIFWVLNTMDKDKEFSRCWNGSEASTFKRLVREGLSDKTLEGGCEETARTGHAHVWRKCFPRRDTQDQGSKPDMGLKHATPTKASLKQI